VSGLSARPIVETDLYPPLRDYLVANGYTVRGEVRDCDIAALKGDDLVIIELKRSVGLPVLMQATQRQRAAESVYIAVPRPPGGIASPRWRKIQHLLRRLELGLILIALDARGRPARRGAHPAVEVVFHPLPAVRRKIRRAGQAVLQEIDRRSGDYNLGGSTRRRIVTAYRENAIHIACCLERFGVLSPKQLRALGTGAKTLSILSSNFYGWFARVGPGRYALAPPARDGLDADAEVSERYRVQVAGYEPPAAPASRPRRDRAQPGAAAPAGPAAA
jgi:hypothetical protein